MLIIPRIETPRAFVPFLKPARYKGARGGRGSAKSHTFAENLIERCLMRKTRWICLREHQISLRQSVKRLLEDKIIKLGVGSMFDVQDRLIKTPYDGELVFSGMKNHTAESIKSYEDFDGSWFEEAQNASQVSLDMLRPTIRNPGSELWFTWNPKNPNDPIDVLLNGAEPPKNSIIETVSWRDNPWFPDELEEERQYDLRRDIDKYNHIWEGQFDVKSEARVFKRWKVANEDDRKELKEFIRVGRVMPRYGGDFGYSIDPAVLIEIYVDKRTRKIYITREAYKVGLEIDHLPKFFLDKVPECKDYRITMDSSRPDSISYMKRHGLPKTLKSKKGPGSIVEGIEFLKSYDIVVFEECIHTIHELTYFSYKVDPLTQEPTNVLQDKTNHVIDSLRYAVEAIRKIVIGVH